MGRPAAAEAEGWWWRWEAAAEDQVRDFLLLLLFLRPKVARRHKRTAASRANVLIAPPLSDHQRLARRDVQFGSPVASESCLVIRHFTCAQTGSSLQIQIMDLMSSSADVTANDICAAVNRPSGGGGGGVSFRCCR